MAQQPSGSNSLQNVARRVTHAISGDSDLGAIKLLPGTWANLRDPDKPGDGPLPGRGWNMTALPFATVPGQGFNYRVLMNQYNERLIIKKKDTGVPNRGIEPNPPTGPTTETDQELVALDYEQGVVHIATADSPPSSLTQPVGAAIHHEPGLFLFMKNQTEDGIDIARLGTIPHGDSLLALGRSSPPESGPPTIPPFNALPIGVGPVVPPTNPYLGPYKHFIDNPFENLFSPDKTHDLLVQGLAGLGRVRETTTLRFSTKIATAGIVNIPFVVKQANATEMDVTFWIMELEELGADGKPRMIMMYHQVVMLEFFDRKDEVKGRIKWPHVSINTMERVLEDPEDSLRTTKDVTSEAI